MNDIIAANLADVTINWTPSDVRSKIYELQKRVEQMPSRLQDCPVEHLFTPGVYCRKMFIPRGIIIIGKIHKHAHPNIVSQGEVEVATEFGLQRIQAYAMFQSAVGTKRAVIAKKDTIWTTVHLNPNNWGLEDLDKLESELIAKDYTELGWEDPQGVLQ